MICRHSASRVSRSRSLLASFGHPPGRGCGRAGQMGRAEHMGMDACRDQSRHDCRPRQHPARTTGPRPTQGFTALDGVPLSGSTPNPYEIGLGDVRALEEQGPDDPTQLRTNPRREINNLETTVAEILPRLGQPSRRPSSSWPDTGSTTSPPRSRRFAAKPTKLHWTPRYSTPSGNPQRKSPLNRPRVFRLGRWRRSTRS